MVRIIVGLIIGFGIYAYADYHQTEGFKEKAGMYNTCKHDLQLCEADFNRTSCMVDVCFGNKSKAKAYKKCEQ